MVPLARLERALLAELHFECSASTDSTTGALWLYRLTNSEIEALLANRLCAGNGFFQCSYKHGQISMASQRPPSE
jgi:hypothetical protein